MEDLDERTRCEGDNSDAGLQSSLLLVPGRATSVEWLPACGSSRNASGDFDPEKWPIISFHLEGNRDALVRESSPGDQILFIATGPRPSTWAGETGRDATEASHTYAFQFGRRDLWKIGHAKDVVARLADVNKHVPSEVLGECWTAALQQRWPNEVAAYEMEQRLLAALRTPSCVGERVACKRQRLESAWATALVAS